MFPSHTLFLTGCLRPGSVLFVYSFRLVELLYSHPHPVFVQTCPFGKGMSKFMICSSNFFDHLSHMQMLSQYGKREEENGKMRKIVNKKMLQGVER